MKSNPQIQLKGFPTCWLWGSVFICAGWRSEWNPDPQTLMVHLRLIHSSDSAPTSFVVWFSGRVNSWPWLLQQIRCLRVSTDSQTFRSLQRLIFSHLHCCFVLLHGSFTWVRTRLDSFYFPLNFPFLIGLLCSEVASTFHCQLMQRNVENAESHFH